MCVLVQPSWQLWAISSRKKCPRSVQCRSRRPILTVVRGYERLPSGWIVGEGFFCERHKLLEGHWRGRVSGWRDVCLGKRDEKMVEDEQSMPGLSACCCCWGGDLSASMCLESGKWSCNGIDVRRSMRGESMRYQLEAAGAAGSMCICTRIE
jgi:hypothetical protein